VDEVLMIFIDVCNDSTVRESTRRPVIAPY
jgi:hypothetical protein